MVPQSINGTNIDYATQYFVPVLPITWTSPSFRGRLTERGPGEDIVDDVSGLASDDGSQLVSLVYSRLVTGSGPNSGTFYQVVLRDIPISSSGVYQGKGLTVQQYVVKVLSGSALNNVPVSWSNSGGGQLPSLTITFSK